MHLSRRRGLRANSLLLLHVYFSLLSEDVGGIRYKNITSQRRIVMHDDDFSMAHNLWTPTHSENLDLAGARLPTNASWITQLLSPMWRWRSQWLSLIHI